MSRTVTTPSRRKTQQLLQLQQQRQEEEEQLHLATDHPASAHLAAMQVVGAPPAGPHVEDEAATDENSTEPRTPELEPGTAMVAGADETHPDETAPEDDPDNDDDPSAAIASRTRSRASAGRARRTSPRRVAQQQEAHDESDLVESAAVIGAQDPSLCLESSQEVALETGVRLRVGMKRMEPSKPWPRWSLRLLDPEGGSIDIDTVDETGASHIASIMNQQVTSYFPHLKSEQEAAAAGIIQMEQQIANHQLALAAAEPMNAFAAYQAADGRLNRLSIQPATKWMQPGAGEMDPEAAAKAAAVAAGLTDEWGTPLPKRRRNSQMNPWHTATAAGGEESMTPTTAGSAGGRDAWSSGAAGADGGSTESDEAGLTAGGNGHLGATSPQQQQFPMQSPYMTAHPAAMQAAAARNAGMMLGPAQQYAMLHQGYPQLMHPQFGGPMVHPFAIHQRSLMMQGGPPLGGGDRSGKRRSKHHLDDTGYGEGSEERNFTEAEKKRLREAPWPDKKRPTGLPTLYCHLCYLREGVFRVVSAISPNPETVYFRHQQCHTSFKRGEDLPKSIVEQYQRWYKNRAQNSGYRGGIDMSRKLGSAGNSGMHSPTGGTGSVDDLKVENQNE